MKLWNLAARPLVFYSTASVTIRGQTMEELSMDAIVGSISILFFISPSTGQDARSCFGKPEYFINLANPHLLVISAPLKAPSLPWRTRGKGRFFRWGYDVAPRNYPFRAKRITVIITLKCVQLVFFFFNAEATARVPAANSKRTKEERKKARSNSTSGPYVGICHHYTEWLHTYSGQSPGQTSPTNPLYILFLRDCCYVVYHLLLFWVETSKLTATRTEGFFLFLSSRAISVCYLFEFYSEHWWERGIHGFRIYI